MELFWHVAHSVPSTDEEQIKALFVRSFLATYRASNAYTDKSDEAVQENLANDFERTVRTNLHREKQQLLVAAKKEGKVVGFALFEPLENDTVYLAELAVSPECWGQGLGRKLTFAILEKKPTTRKIVFVTEHINKWAHAFYEALGFQPSDYTHEGYSPTHFRGYEKNL